MHGENFSRARKLFERYNICPLFGVIPDNQDPELLRFPHFAADFWQEARNLIASGWDCAMHGYQHLSLSQDGGLLGRNKHSEFSKLSYDAQLEKLRCGRELLQSRGIHTEVFMAPWHSFDHNTLMALKQTGFRTVTDGVALFPYRYQDLLFVPQLLARPNKFPLGLFTFCLHLNNFSALDFQLLESFLQRYAKFSIAFRDAHKFIPGANYDFVNRSLGRAIECLRLARHNLVSCA